MPADSVSLALVADDPDAVGGLYIHRIVTCIPPSTVRHRLVQLPLPALCTGRAVAADTCSSRIGSEPVDR
ncbi:MAG TPA: hypothetical protein VKA77_14805 [Mycobacterium sp.]|nr:hypothetical protein [Mycobacterium sp.]